jgi:hypothetical protein
MGCDHALHFAVEGRSTNHQLTIHYFWLTIASMGMNTRAKSSGKKEATEAAESPDSLTTAMHLPKSTWELLRAVAFRRAQVSGGRASVSKVVTGLVEEKRLQLEKEISQK